MARHVQLIVEKPDNVYDSWIRAFSINDAIDRCFNEETKAFIMRNFSFSWHPLEKEGFRTKLREKDGQQVFVNQDAKDTIKVLLYYEGGILRLLRLKHEHNLESVSLMILKVVTLHYELLAKSNPSYAALASYCQFACELINNLPREKKEAVSNMLDMVRVVAEHVNEDTCDFTPLAYRLIKTAEDCAAYYKESGLRRGFPKEKRPFSKKIDYAMSSVPAINYLIMGSASIVCGAVVLGFLAFCISTAFIALPLPAMVLIAAIGIAMLIAAVPTPLLATLSVIGAYNCTFKLFNRKKNYVPDEVGKLERLSATMKAFSCDTCGMAFNEETLKGVFSIIKVPKYGETTLQVTTDEASEEGSSFDPRDGDVVSQY